MRKRNLKHIIEEIRDLIKSVSSDLDYNGYVYFDVECPDCGERWEEEEEISAKTLDLIVENYTHFMEAIKKLTDLTDEIEVGYTECPICGQWSLPHVHNEKSNERE